MFKKLTVVLVLLVLAIGSGAAAWAQGNSNNANIAQNVPQVLLAPASIIFYYSPGEVDMIAADKSVEVRWHPMAELEEPAAFYATKLTGESGSSNVGIDPSKLLARTESRILDNQFLPLDQYVALLSPDVDAELIEFQLAAGALVGLPVQTYSGWIQPEHDVRGNASGRIRVIVKPRTELTLDQQVIVLRVKRPIEDFVSNTVNWRLSAGTTLNMEFASIGEPLMGPHYEALKDHLRYVVTGGVFDSNQRSFAPGDSIISSTMDLDGIMDGTIRLEYSYDPSGTPWTRFPSGGYSDLVTVTVSEIL